MISGRHILNLIVPGWIVLWTAIIGQTDELIGPFETQLGTGKMAILWKAHVAQCPDHVVLHFHGGARTVQAAFLRSDLNGVLVVVNFPGLSSAYARPFSDDSQLFETVLERAQRAVQQHTVPKSKSIEWKRVTLSSFSAGYGSVREILKTPKHFERVDEIVAADSIYAGLLEDQPDRQVDVTNMQHFLQFARLSVDGEKSFVISHSSQATPYASTTETADYLLRALQIARKSDRTIRTEALQQRTLGKRRQFSVLGFEGTSGKQHMLHLHHIDLLWNRLPVARAH